MAVREDELSVWQKHIREKSQNLAYRNPPATWQGYSFVSAAGIYGGGWTSENEFVLLSTDGYSIFNPITKQAQKYLNPDNAEDVLTYLSEDDSEFVIPITNEKIRISGVMGGDGIHHNGEWSLRVIYPWYPDALFVIYQNNLTDWDNVYPLRFQVLSSGNWIKYGFSSSKKLFAIWGEAGAEFYYLSNLS